MIKVQYSTSANAARVDFGFKTNLIGHHSLRENFDETIRPRQHRVDPDRLLRDAGDLLALIGQFLRRAVRRLLSILKHPDYVLHFRVHCPQPEDSPNQNIQKEGRKSKNLPEVSREWHPEAILITTIPTIRQARTASFRSIYCKGFPSSSIIKITPTIRARSRLIVAN